jgi:Bor protein
MNRLQKVALVVTTVLLPACWHATIETGLTPSTQVIQKDWASAWIYGLVPPSTVETRSKCPNGVAKVETQLSFLNMLVTFLTLDIYSPMSIKVTCAQGGRAAVPAGAPEIRVGANASGAQLSDAFAQAAATVLKTGAPVYVDMR